MLVFEAFRPEELQFTKDENATSGTVLSLKELKKKKLKLNAFGDTKEYDNYRSSSWDSSHVASDGAELIDPLIMKDEKTKAEFLKNPYQAYKRSQSKKAKKKMQQVDDSD